MLNPRLFADADEDAIVEIGPFAKVSTAGAIRLLANYCVSNSGVQFSFKDPWYPQLVRFEFPYNYDLHSIGFKTGVIGQN